MPPVRVLLLALLPAVPATARGIQIPLRLGQTVSGRLTTTDQQFGDGSHYKMYLFAGSAGDTITADLRSDDFDANLVLTDASGNRLRVNDDGGDDCNARLLHVLPAAANYRLYANSSAAAELGAYRLSLVRGRGAAPADTTCRGFGRVAGLVQVGQSLNGSLTPEDAEFTDSTYYRKYVLPVEPNQAFTVDLQSNDFNAFLMLERGRAERLVQNDDGGGGCHARIVYTAPDDRPLRIVVNTASRPPRQTGRYTLRISDGESPPEPKGNCRFRPAAGPAVAARPITVGQTVTGALSRADQLYSDTTYYQEWQFTAAPGREITIDLASDDFDPFVIVRGDDLERSLTDDDGGPGCAARIAQAFPGRGPYTILVNTTSDPYRQTGRYTLSVTEGRKEAQRREGECQPPQRRTREARNPPPGPGEVRAERGGTAGAARTIGVGQTVQGELTRDDHFRRSDSTYAQTWSLEGRAGQTVTVDLESDAFDAFVFVAGPGIERNLQDDDSGGNCNARVTVTFAEAGTYTVVVNTADRHATGRFSLSVTSGSKPASLSRCSRSR